MDVDKDVNIISLNRVGDAVLRVVCVCVVKEEEW
jgi:hypothetical protein